MLKTTAVKILRVNQEKVFQYSLILLSIAIPLFISKPQLLVGSSINAIILLSTYKYGVKKSLPIYILPSLTSIGKGLLFSTFTPFLLYLSPFIILSNIIFASVANKKHNLIYSIVGLTLKITLLYSATNILINTINLPNIFLKSMGYMQIITGIIGIALTIIIMKVMNPNTQGSE